MFWKMESIMLESSRPVICNKKHALKKFKSNYHLYRSMSTYQDLILCPPQNPVNPVSFVIKDTVPLSKSNDYYSSYSNVSLACEHLNFVLYIIHFQSK